MMTVEKQKEWKREEEQKEEQDKREEQKKSRQKDQVHVGQKKKVLVFVQEGHSPTDALLLHFLLR